MQKHFERYMSTLGLKEGLHKVLLTVSGGRDSICMCELFLHSGYSFGIAHCNFNLRDEESDGDETFVKDYAESNNIPLYVTHFDTNAYAAEKNISIQMAARDLRYEWFYKVAKEQGYDFVATAHHLDDQTETFFINLIRGTGIAGLHGILPVSGKLLRPLLFATRDDINNYLSENNVAYRDDSSNASVKYLRNKIRHEILPHFEAIEPGFAKKINDTAELLRKGEMIIDKSLELAKHQIVRETNEMTVIDKRELMCAKPSDYYLYNFIKPYGFTASQSENIIDALAGQSGKHFFSEKYKLIIGRKGLIIVENSHEKDTDVFLVEDDIEQITIPLCLEMKREQIVPSSFTFPKEEREVCLDAEKLHFPLKVRKWQKGDFFFPLGMDNKKLLSDYFIDEKFELPQKNDTWLLLSQDDIIWIVGHRIDNRYRVTDSTKEIIRFSICK